MLKVFEALEATRLRQVVPMNRGPLKFSVSMECERAEIPERFRWRYGVDLRCHFLGQRGSEPQHLQAARRLIGKELYGELCDDLIDLLGILHGDEYRRPDDPVCRFVERMITKMRGEDAG